MVYLLYTDTDDGQYYHTQSYPTHLMLQYRGTPTYTTTHNLTYTSCDNSPDWIEKFLLSSPLLTPQTNVS